MNSDYKINGYCPWIGKKWHCAYTVTSKFIKQSYIKCITMFWPQSLKQGWWWMKLDHKVKGYYPRTAKKGIFNIVKFTVQHPDLLSN